MSYWWIVGTRKSFLAQSIGYAAIMVGYTARFLHTDIFFRTMTQARVDNSLVRTFRSSLSPDLLILDDLGLHRLTPQQSAGLYQLIISRHRVSSFVITSNRAVEEWLSLFDVLILGNSARARLTNASYQIVIKGTSYLELTLLIRGLRSLMRWLTPHSRNAYSLHRSRPRWTNVCGDDLLMVYNHAGPVDIGSTGQVAGDVLRDGGQAADGYLGRGAY